MLQYINKKTGSNPKILVIWLHGLGADGHDFEPIVPFFKNSAFDIEFIFPHAPIQPVTINGGMAMRAWYDIKMLDIGKMPDAAGIEQSAQQINALIDQQIANGYQARQIVLAGFSQGGAMALHISTRMSQQLAGVIALSCYLPLEQQFNSEQSGVNRQTPYFIGHGTQDPVVPFELGKTSAATLEQQQYNISWHQYPIPHSVSPEELQDIKQFILSLQVQ